MASHARRESKSASGSVMAVLVVAAGDDHDVGAGWGERRSIPVAVGLLDREPVAGEGCGELVVRAVAPFAAGAEGLASFGEVDASRRARRCPGSGDGAVVAADYGSRAVGADEKQHVPA